MAVKKLTYGFPALISRALDTPDEVASYIRTLITGLQELHKRVVEVMNSNATVLTPIEAAGAPASAPPAKGMHYINTSTGAVYYAIDTSGSGDWKLIT